MTAPERALMTWESIFSRLNKRRWLTLPRGLRLFRLDRKNSATRSLNVQLGMSAEEILSVFHGSHDLPNLQRALEPFMSSKPSGFTIVQVENRRRNPELNQIRDLSLQFRNYRLISFTAHYSSPQWESVDQFIQQRSHLLNLTGVNWNPIDGNSQASKYVICDGVEIRFYAAPAGVRNLNAISVTDVALEKAIQAAKSTDPTQP